MRLLLLLSFIALQCCDYVQAQVKTDFNSTDSLPASGRYRKNYKAGIYQVAVPDTQKLKQRARDEAVTEGISKGPFNIAEPMPVSIDVAQLASWVTTGDKAYGKFTLQAVGAKSLSINFSPFYLPEGTEMFIYNQHGKMITGPVTPAENNELQSWGSAIYKDDIVNIEISVPVSRQRDLRLTIVNVAYGYKQVFVQKLGGFGQSGSCNINVLCPQGTGWENERNSVAVVALQNGSALCSGAMLNNTCNSNTPYFLTANHCFTANGGQNVGNWRFYFQAWSSTCSPSQNSNGLLFNGSTLRANWAPTDFALVQLNQAPAPNSGINYAGWSRSTTAATSGVGIHHPSGDVMKISTYTTPVVRADNFTWNINGQTLNPVGDLQWIVSWNNGVTEGGSSGSPLFDQNHRVIGQLGGGPSGCGNAVQQDAYGRFDNSWTGGGTNATRLSNWLDPIGSNALTANTVNVSALASSSTPINGDGEICSGSKTYTVNTGVVTGWSISPSSGIATIQGNGNSATVTATGTGSVTISATLCGVADPIYKNISVGAAPVYPTFISYGYWNSYPNPATNLYASVCRSSSYPYNQPIQLAYPIGVQNLVAYPYSGSGYPTVYQNTITWDSYSGTLRVEYDVACGHVVQFLHFTNTCGYGSYTVYPNPGGDDVILSEQVAAKEADPGKAKAKTIEVQVTDHLGQARIRKTFARSNNYKLNVRQLPEGVYFIRITDGENVYNEKLVIRR